jgi:hypothetical protein
MDTINKLIVNLFETVSLSDKTKLIVITGTEEDGDIITVSYLKEDRIFDYDYEPSSLKRNGSVFTAQEFIDNILKGVFIASLELQDNLNTRISIFYQKHP